MNEHTISVSKKELEYILDSLQYSLYSLLKSFNFSKLDNCNDIEICTNKDKLLTLLTMKEIENLENFDYFKKLDLYLKIRKKLLGF